MEEVAAGARPLREVPIVRRGGQSGQRQVARIAGERERDTEGDLLISGRNLAYLLLVDTHIVSLNTPSRVKEWAEQKKAVKTLPQKQLRDAVAAKQSHYARKTRAVAPGVRIDANGPLMTWGVDLIAAVATPTGIISPEMDRLLGTLACHKVDTEEQDSRIEGRSESQARIRRAFTEARGLFRRIVATALVRSASRTFTTDPQRLDRRRRAEERIEIQGGGHDAQATTPRTSSSHGDE